MLEEQTLFTHALGLSTTPNFFIAAIGNQSFFLSDKTLVKLPQAFHKKVHGFALNHECLATRLLLLYTENEFSLFKCDVEQEEIFELVYEGETKDWINAATFLTGDKNCQFVLHMAHSALLHIQYDTQNTKKRGCTILELACCTDYSLLYHTSLNGDRYDELIVISGNGFGEIIVWQLHSPAHNGVIFSINLNLSAQLLVTTSDDRSLKFWKIENSSSKEWKWDAVSLMPMFSCFGHTARVICAVIAEYDGEVFVISGGEDSNICIWSKSGDMLFKRRQQFGAPIWRLGFDPTTSTLYSTGSTGNVLAYNIHTILKRNQTQLTHVMTIDSATEFMKKIKYLNYSTIIGLSNKNRLFLMKISKSHKMLNWELVIEFPAYQCTVLAVCDGLIATCGDQRITLLSYSFGTEKFHKLYDGVMLDGRIQSFHFLSKELYLISSEFGKCLILKGYNMDIDGSIKLNNCREPWITAAMLVSSKCLVLSSRNGHVMLCTREGSSHFQLKNTLKRLHGNMGSTFLKLLNIDGKYAYILSGGHEPVLKYLRLSLTDYRLTILRRECVPLAWIEASPTLDILIGFNDNHFVAWSRQNDVLLQLNCGGGHRCWDYKLNNGELHVVYVKQKKVFYHNELLYNQCHGRLEHALRNRWHTRSCNIIQIMGDQNDTQPYIVTAGDDNIIKISRYIGKSFHQCVELHTHISSVRHLTTYRIKCENDSSCWLIFSVGGRAQLCINHFDPNGPVVKELCSYTMRSNAGCSTALLDARLMSINVQQNTERGEFFLYVASADGKIRRFRWQLENPSQFQLIQLVDIRRCPLQLHSFNHLNLLLITTTNGVLYGFDLTLCFKRFQLQLHAAGINAIETLVDDKLLHVLSGGDDENIKHTTIKLADMSVKRITEFSGLHNAQVNALSLYQGVGPATDLCAYTCSIDKQIYMVNLTTQQYNRIGYTCISDVKGIVLDKYQRLYIYGCGLQVMTLKSKA